ncbi:MAG: VOC family protein [Acidobacteriota bacterium]|nr:VOC family protein [Acidobacteriota bacterium]
MQARKKPETLRLRAVMPTLTVGDMSTSIAWYRDVLGFIVVNEMTHEDKLVGAVIKAGNAEFLLGQDDWAKGRDRHKGAGLRLYCTTVQDIDQLAADIVARGGTLAYEPTDQPWGARDFGVVDPDGFAISVSTAMSADE